MSSLKVARNSFAEAVVSVSVYLFYCTKFYCINLFSCENRIEKHYERISDNLLCATFFLSAGSSLETETIFTS